MTVIYIDENSVTCVWSVKGDSKSKSYPAEALKKATKPLTLEQLVLDSIKLRQEETIEEPPPCSEPKSTV